MNKKERSILCLIFAEHEWSSSGSSSEAAGIASITREIRGALGITDEDMEFARTWVISKNIGLEEDDIEEWDELSEWIEEDYEGFCDFVDEQGMSTVWDNVRDELNLRIKSATFFLTTVN